MIVHWLPADGGLISPGQLLPIKMFCHRTIGAFALHMRYKSHDALAASVDKAFANHCVHVHTELLQLGEYVCCTRQVELAYLSNVACFSISSGTLQQPTDVAQVNERW